MTADDMVDTTEFEEAMEEKEVKEVGSLEPSGQAVWNRRFGVVRGVFSGNFYMDESGSF